MRFGTIYKTFSLSLLMLVFITMSGNDARAEFRLGDINEDGWCNIADVVSLVCYFRGATYLRCPEAADVNGDGVIAGGDIDALLDFLSGTAGPPVNACPWPAAQQNCTESATWWFGEPISSGTTNTVTLSVEDATTPISVIHFSLVYNSTFIASIHASSLITSCVAHYYERAYCADNPDLRLVTIAFDSPFNHACQSIDMSSPTQVLTLTINKAVTAPLNQYFNIAVAYDDTIGGPPAAYASNYALRFKPRCHVMVMGDNNGDGSVLGSDVTWEVRYFKSLGPAPIGYYCDCIPIIWR